MAFGKYNILTTKEQLLELDAFLTEGAFPLISIDTETNGLHFWKNLVIGLSLSVNSKDGFYIPFLTWKPDLTSIKTRKVDKVDREIYEKGDFECVWTGKHYPEDVRPEEYEYPKFIIDLMKKWFVEAEPQFIMHNAPFDVLMIETSLGINLQNQVFCDTLLLKHIIDENSSNGLKETAIKWAKELGIPVQDQANKEQLEMAKTIIRNGGEYRKKRKDLWRADLDVFGKYAVADTFLTFGLFEVGLDKLTTEYEPKHLNWFFDDEVMPLCREVIIPMKRHGVYTDQPYFIEMEEETRLKMRELEDEVLTKMGNKLEGFSIGSSIDELISRKAVIEFLIEREGLEYPIAKGKRTLAKPTVTKAFAESGHWLWGYIIGENELPFSEKEFQTIKTDLYEKKMGRRHQFKITSDLHLRWLFCTKLGTPQESLPQTDSATKDHAIASMAAKVLKEHFYAKYDFVKPLLLYKKLLKLHSSYILPAITLQNKGYLHMDFLQAGTISGRFACRGGFNLQTLPKVESLSKCYKCGSKDIIVVNPIKLVAVMACNDCGHIEEDIICPSAIKKGFIAPPGMKIVNADYSSLEPRCFSFVSGDPKLKAIYLENLDMYSKVYCDMEDPEGKYSPDPKAPNFLKKLAPEKRDEIKPTVLGIPYGARGPQTAKMMNFTKILTDRHGTREVLDVERGKAFREKYLNTYPHLKAYMEGQDAKACSLGFVETLIGRRRHFKFTVPVYKILSDAGISIDEFMEVPRKKLKEQHIDDEYFTIHALKNLADKIGFNMKDEKGVPRAWDFVRAMFKNELNNSKNMPIQGLGAHITNRGMLEMAREFRKKGLQSQVVLQTHDEVGSYAYVEEVELTVQIQKACMENNLFAKMVDIPMVAEPIVCDNLKDSK